jgi:hypothetical protein
VGFGLLATLLVVAGVLTQAYLAFVWAALACGGDGGEPYAAPASTLGRLCSYLDGHPAVYVFAVVGVVVVLGMGLSTSTASGSRRPFFVAACIAGLWLVLQLAAMSALPQTCSPDDESRPGCSHY